MAIVRSPTLHRPAHLARAIARGRIGRGSGSIAGQAQGLDVAWSRTSPSVTKATAPAVPGNPEQQVAHHRGAGESVCSRDDHIAGLAFGHGGTQRQVVARPQWQVKAEPAKGLCARRWA